MEPISDLSFGVCILPEMPRNAARTVRYPNYLLETLQQLGFCHVTLDWESLPEKLPAVRVLLTVGETKPSDTFREALRPWIEAGGAWIAVAGASGCPDLLGIETESPSYSSWGGGISTLGEGYLRACDPVHPILRDLPIPLHYFNGSPARTAGATVLAECLNAHQHATGRVALSIRAVGSGLAVFLAPNIPGTLVRVQQGVSITRDGVPSDDGTAPIDDAALKSGDGGVLDWVFDRQDVPGVPGLKAYLEPVAEWWRTLLTRTILFAARETGTSLPLLWYWPNHLDGIGHISHDTDGNWEEHAWRLLDVLEEAGIHSTWCVILPGFPPGIIEAIRAAGHELATHYDAISDGCVWSEEEFSRQHAELVALFGGERPVSNKNHFLRWEGDTEFFDWCAKKGIRLDQTKGVSKTGEAGYNFGACRPYRPVAPDGRLIDVLELPTPAQDLCVFGPAELLRPLHKAARDHYGVFHLLFHPAHILKEGVPEALKEAVRVGKESGMEFWTAAQLAEWDRLRRGIRWATEGEANAWIESDEPVKGVTVLWLAAEGQTPSVNGCPANLEIERWGFRFHAVTLDLAGAGKENAHENNP